MCCSVPYAKHVPLDSILTLHPLVESRIQTLQQTAPSQTEVTNFYCSDHLNTSKKWPRGERKARILNPCQMKVHQNLQSPISGNGWVVWAVQNGDFRPARCRPPEGSNPTLHQHVWSENDVWYIFSRKIGFLRYPTSLYDIQENLFHSICPEILPTNHTG